MKFTVNTKPLSQCLDLGVINSNISKFYRKSGLAQIEASETTLKINLEVASVVTELTLKGFGDSKEPAMIFVDPLLLKQLVSTFETSTTVFEFEEGGLVLHSGNSKFNLPRLVDNNDLSLRKPGLVDPSYPTAKIDKSDWKFIKDHQMYAIAMSFTKPIYTRVWVSDDKDVLVCDFDNGMFTHSKKNKLNKTCLLSSSIINLLDSLPENSVIVDAGSSYIIQVTEDSFQYVSEFMPEFESNPDIGSYHAELIMQLTDTSESSFVSVPSAAITKFMSQAGLLSSSTEDTIDLILQSNVFMLKDQNVECKLNVEGDCPDFTCKFRTSHLQSVFNHFEGEKLSISPVIRDGEVTGAVVWDGSLTTVLAEVEN